MPASKLKPATHNSPADSTRAVEEFMGTLVHPQKAAVEALRTLILSVDPSISEGIKWNSPSFRTTEYFGTVNLRAKSGIRVILHLGAKIRELPAGGVSISDPNELLRWLGKDRAMVEFADIKELKSAQPALQAILRQWIKFV